MRLGPREILFLLLLLAMPVAAYRFVFEPRNDQIHRARAQIAEKRQKLHKLHEAAARMQDVGQEIERMTQAVQLFEQKLPSRREEEVILKEVWETASRHGLVPRSIRTENAVTASHYAEIPLKMVITGDFDGFYSFMLDLEKMRRVTRLPQLRLEKKPDAGEGEVVAELVLNIFYDTKAADRMAAEGNRL